MLAHPSCARFFIADPSFLAAMCLGNQSSSLLHRFLQRRVALDPQSGLVDCLRQRFQAQCEARVKTILAVILVLSACACTAQAQDAGLRGFFADSVSYSRSPSSSFLVPPPPPDPQKPSR